MMNIYLVGGAVRDKLLGLPVKERDWVVVGSTRKEMLQRGFRQVGKDFPVFLHPETNEEYALARTERKCGAGYTGFTFDATATVTLTQDLQRRDLTINAIAQSADGELIDPNHGQKDLQAKILRHVSPAFIEDPVRILRVARFAARFGAHGFTLAAETLALMKTMVANGEVNSLVAERVWKELSRALSEDLPSQFFLILEQCNALPVLFPAIDILGPGIAALNAGAAVTDDPEIRLALLVHNLAQAEIQQLATHYRIPNNYAEFALLLAKNLSHYAAGLNITPAEILTLLESTDAFRREDRFKKFLLAAEIITQISLTPLLLKCLQALKAINIQEIIAQHSGAEIGKQIQQARLKLITTIVI
jgi:tRNA nucleotidyltransferase (CCA-adding enzyme)